MLSLLAAVLLPFSTPRTLSSQAVHVQHVVRSGGRPVYESQLERNARLRLTAETGGFKPFAGSAGGTTPPSGSQTGTGGTGSTSAISNVAMLQSWTVRDYSDSDWQALYANLVQAGFTSVVLMTSVDESRKNLGNTNPIGSAAAYNSTNMQIDAYYPTCSVPNQTEYKNPNAAHDLVEECLFYAKQLNAQRNSQGLLPIKVYIGLNLFGEEWFTRTVDPRVLGLIPPVNDSAFMTQEESWAEHIADDIYRLYSIDYRDNLAGWYWPWEIDNLYFDPVTDSTDNQVAYNNLSLMLTNSLSYLNSHDGGLPRMLSPFFNPNHQRILNYSPNAYANVWRSFFSLTKSGSNVFTTNDIIALQDGIGDGHEDDSGVYVPPIDVSAIPSLVGPWFSAMQGAMLSQSGKTMQLWTNADTYIFQSYPTDVVHDDGNGLVFGTLQTAALSRVVAQLNAEGPYVTGRVTFTYGQYDNPQKVNASINTAWLAYNANHPITTIPTTPNTPSLGHNGGSTTLSWPAVVNSANGTVYDYGFIVYRDGVVYDRILFQNPYQADLENPIWTEIPKATLAAGQAVAYTDPDTNSYNTYHYYTVVSFDATGNMSAPTAKVNTISVSSMVANPSIVIGGSSSLVAVNLSRPALTGGTTVFLSSGNVQVATIPTSVTVPAGASSVSITATTFPQGSTSTDVLTASVGQTFAQAVLTVAEAQLSTFTISPSPILAGAGSNGIIVLSGPAGPSGHSISLSASSTSVSVPASVTAPSGAVTVNFPITTQRTASAGDVTISASDDSASLSSTFAIVGLTLTFSPTSASGGAIVAGTATIGFAAPAGGQIVVLDPCGGVTFSSMNLTIPQGSFSTTFTMVPFTVPNSQTVLIHAWLSPFSSVGGWGRFTITTLTLASVGMLPATVSQGASSTCQVLLSGPAPSGGVTVALASNNPNATIQSSVFIPAGSIGMPVTVTTKVVGSTQTAVITASYAGKNISANLTITP